MTRGINNDLMFGVAVALVAFVVYINSLGNGFVWDDELVILANPAVKGALLDIFKTIDTGRATELTPYYRPLSLLSYVAEYHIHGFNPFLVRIVNVLLHAVNTFLVYQVGLLLLKNRSAAVMASLLFAVHPLQSETVDFNSCRNILLVTFFILCTYLVHAKSIRDNTVAGALGGALLLFLGFLSKEIAIALVPLVGFIEIAQLRAKDVMDRRKAVFRLIPYVVAVVVYLVMRNNALSAAGVTLKIFPGLGSRLLDNLYIIPRYLLSFVWPLLLNCRYFIPEDLHLFALPLIVAWLSILGILWWLLVRHRTTVTLFGLAWLVVFWLPVSGIVSIPSAPLADRYLYIPAIGLWLLVADQTMRFFPAAPVAKRWCGAIITILLLSLAVVTVRQNRFWRTDVALFSRHVKLYPDQVIGYHNLGCAYMDKEKNLYLAEQAFDKALVLDPAFPRLQTQLGYLRLQRGDYEGALQHYREAIRLNPLDAEAHLNSGDALEKLFRYGEALSEYQRFLETPGNELPEARRATVLKVKELLQRPGVTGRREPRNDNPK